MNAANRDEVIRQRLVALFNKNPVSLITGASRGIGRGISMELAKIGFDLIIDYASNTKAAQQTADDCVALAKTLGKTIRAETCQADISIAKDRQKLLAFAKNQFRRLDLLVNNAGVAPESRDDILE